MSYEQPKKTDTHHQHETPDPDEAARYVADSARAHIEAAARALFRAGKHGEVTATVRIFADRADVELTGTQRTRLVKLKSRRQPPTPPPKPPPK